MIEMVLGSEVNGKLLHITAEEGGVPRLSDNTEPAEQLDLTNSETP
jgi:hypothetical protein